jgi:hypothetical protein
VKQKESPILREIEYCLSHYGFFVIPRDTRASHGDGWSIWKEIDPTRYVGVIWRSNTGAMRNERKRLVRFGVPGLPDFAGWLFSTGQRISLEVKTQEGKLTVDQQAYLALAYQTGILSAVVRSYKDCEQLLTEWRIPRKA